ncbi:Ca-activated chloride channel family protein [Persephonella hydrogeniphila]|uniref:Ca-activated chloride channel family protein n=1 Tax=Persephonella hydrogeniphila TaxID=198703 RepID=A0A285N0K8_9AQUI|nr:VWA domain-containing protein [Persephonella hydrogeniphila]SNZ02972.1 Ca-activated chloride channel family protein [Persephonella hydrogeniphila]
MIEFLDKSYLWLIILLIGIIPVAFKRGVVKRIEFWMIFLLLFLLIIILARPVIKSGEKAFYKKDTEVVILLDSSLSMGVKDIKPDRLHFALKKLKKLVEDLKDEKVGLIVFSDKAEIISFPYQKITPEDINNLSLKPEGSTDMLSAFSTANSVLTGKERIVILVSDGGDEDLEKVKELIEQSGIRVVFYGVATEKGGKVPGYNALSQLNREMVAVARENGIFVKATESDNDIRKISEYVKNISEKTKTILIKVSSKIELSPFIALVSLGVVFGGFFMRRFIAVILFSALVFTPSYSGELSGFFYYITGNYKKAATEFLEDKTPENMYNAALSYFKAGMYENAEAVLKEIKTENVELKKKIKYTFALCLIARKKFKKAEKVAEELIEIYPQDRRIRKLYQFTNMVVNLGKKPEKRKTIVKIKEKKSRHFKASPMEIGERNPW